MGLIAGFVFALVVLFVAVFGTALSMRQHPFKVLYALAMLVVLLFISVLLPVLWALQTMYRFFVVKLQINLSRRANEGRLKEQHAD
jgi:Mg2+/Co2+ transporter CorB